MATLIESPSVSVIRREVERFLGTSQRRSEFDVDRRRRVLRRYHRSWPLLVRRMGAGDTDVSVALYNASELGIAFLTQDQPPVGTTVFIRLFWHDNGAPWVPAVVRHTTPGEHGYLVGCEFALDDEAACDRALNLEPAWHE